MFQFFFFKQANIRGKYELRNTILLQRKCVFLHFLCVCVCVCVTSRYRGNAGPFERMSQITIFFADVMKIKRNKLTQRVSAKAKHRF